MIAHCDRITAVLTQASRSSPVNNKNIYMNENVITIEDKK